MDFIIISAVIPIALGLLPNVNSKLLPNKLTKNHISRIKNYKYTVVDTSPTLKYTNPCYNYLSQFCADWMSPNFVTLSGIFFQLCYYSLDCYYNPGQNDPSNIPRYVAFVTSFFHLLGFTLDSIDGKLARRRGTSNFTGELLDHGLDTVVHMNVSMVCCSAMSCKISNPWAKMYINFGPSIAMTSLMVSKLFEGRLDMPWTGEPGHIIFSSLYLYFGLSGKIDMSDKVIWFLLFIYFPLLYFEALKCFYDCFRKYGKQVFWVTLPYIVNIASFILLNLVLDILGGKSEHNVSAQKEYPYIVRFFYFAFNMKNASLTYRLIFSQTVEINLAIWTSKLIYFYLDVWLIILGCWIWPVSNFWKFVMLGYLVAYDTFSFVHGFYRILRLSADVLGVNLLLVKDDSKGDTCERAE